MPPVRSQDWGSDFALAAFCRVHLSSQVGSHGWLRSRQVASFLASLPPPRRTMSTAHRRPPGRSTPLTSSASTPSSAGAPHTCPDSRCKHTYCVAHRRPPCANTQNLPAPARQPDDSDDSDGRLPAVRTWTQRCSGCATRPPAPGRSRVNRRRRRASTSPSQRASWPTRSCTS